MSMLRPLSKGMEDIMQLPVMVFFLSTHWSQNFGRQSASRQNARRECCKSCDLGPEFGGEVEPPEHLV